MQKFLSFEKLEQDNVWHLGLKNILNYHSIVRIAVNSSFAD